MTLQDHFESTGNWLFRRRGVLPLLLFPLFFIALLDPRYPGTAARVDLWDGLCLLLSLAGFGLRVVTVGFAAPGTSGRNRGAQVAASLNTTGMYSLVRHPLYLANYLMWLGVAAFPRAWWLPLVVSLVFALYYERIMFAEEAFLEHEFGAAFAAWASRTPAFFPRRLRWRAPERPFSWGTVLRREYSGLWALVAVFTTLDLASGVAQTGRVGLDPVWGAAFAATTLLAIVLRVLRHRTRMLDRGR